MSAQLLLCTLLLCAASGMAQDFNVDYLGKLTYTNQVLANVWGYESGGKEYALVGAKNGLSIVDVTDPANPDEIVQLSGVSSSWREIKTYSHYAYVVSEGGDGVYIVNLNGLPTPPPASQRHSYFGNGAINGLLQKAHALHIDQAKGYLYVYGSYLSNNSNNGKPLIFNLNPDPYNPVYVGVYTPPFSPVYAHDGYVDNDWMYSAHINAGKFAMVDMFNKTAPITRATQTTPGAFTHNTWLSGNTLMTTDEVSGSFLTAYDVSDYNDITELDRIQCTPGSGSIVHNTHIVNNYAVTSWYKDGISIVDINRPENLIQTGRYDTYPNDSGNGFEGCWGVYPYLPSGNILASNIRAQGTFDGELWILSPNYTRGCYLEGRVTRLSDGQPLNGALIEILGTDVSESCNSGGYYKTGHYESGMYEVRISKTGYQTWTGNVLLNNGVLTTLNVALLIPAAVTLTAFDVEAAGENALLRWSTAQEKNNKGFEVQHSAGSTAHWKPIGFVDGAGDADTPQEYHFATPTLSPGLHYFRLRQVDHSGAEQYTEAKALRLENKAFQALMMPNVVQDNAVLRLFSDKNMHVRIEVRDATAFDMGISWELDLEQETLLPMELGMLPAGVYHLYIITEFGEDVVLKWVKQ